MDLKKQREVLDILDEVLALPLKNRSSYLDAVCGEDTFLRREIEACIQSDAAHWVPLHKFDESPSHPKKIGPFLLEKTLGEGGMGTVFLGTRSDGAYDQKVAIKVLKAGIDHDAVLQRFLAERQILAQLDHPNIAKLLDGGTTQGGLPYFVMEYVQGKPITQYCFENRLTIQQRLTLFLEVCDALSYAQNNFIVHRDIKPSNVLVTAKGIPKLLDFGIAKLLQPHPTTTPLTVTENRLMTPVYACPEQFMGGPVTTALDVYGLGLLLFELLTGQRPFRLKDRSLREVTQTICEIKPEKPSQIVASLSKSNPRLSPEDSLDLPGGSGVLKKWSAALKGDLDNITLKALRKDPNDRYSSAALLAEDIGRYLNCRPVLAQKENKFYVLKKFLIRHRLTLSLVSLVAIVFLGFTWHTVIQRNKLSIERARVISERDKTQEMMGFLITLFSIPNTSPRNHRLTVEELLGQGIGKIQRGDYAPKTQADLITTMGVLYRGLGQFEQSEKLLKQGLKIRRDLFGVRHGDVIQGTNEMGRLHLARGGFNEAEELMQQALANLGDLPPESSVITQTYTVFSEVLRAKGDYPSAALYCEKALYLQRKYLAKDHPDVAVTLNQMALILEFQGDFATALKNLEVALEIAKKRRGERPGLPFEILSNMASVYQSRGDFELAEKAYDQVLGWQRKTLGGNHPAVALTLHNLGTLYQNTGQIQLAQEVLLQSLVINQNIHGPDSPFASTILYNLSGIYHLQGLLEKAETSLKKVINIDHKTLGENHPNMAMAFGFLGAIQAEKKDFDQAITHYQKALGILAETVGESHQDYALSLGNYGVVLKQKGDFKEAEKHLRQSLTIFQNLFGRNNIHTGNAFDRLASFLVETQSLQEAETLFRDALTIFQESQPTDHLLVVSVKKRLAECLAKQARFEEAEPYLLEAHRYVRSMDGPLAKSQSKYLLQALVNFYGQWGKSDLVARYESALTALANESPTH